MIELFPGRIEDSSVGKPLPMNVPLSCWLAPGSLKVELHPSNVGREDCRGIIDVLS